MVSFSSTVRFCWWLIYFLLHKLIIPFFIDEIYWFSWSQWPCCGWNKRFLSCLGISVLFSVLLYTGLLLIAGPASSWKNSLSREFLQNQNKSPWYFRAKIQTLFQNWFFRWQKFFFWYVEYDWMIKMFCCQWWFLC